MKTSLILLVLTLTSDTSIRPGCCSISTRLARDWLLTGQSVTLVTSDPAGGAKVVVAASRSNDPIGWSLEVGTFQH